MTQLLRVKSIESLIATAETKKLVRSLGPVTLIALGIGAVVGSGIFTVTGTAAAGMRFDYHSILHAPVLDVILHGTSAVSMGGRPGAGPAVSLSFLLVAIVCGLAALCYAELASMIPVSGSAYTYAYATMGEIFAWIIGWDLILEYAVSNMAVAVGFSAYFNQVCDALLGRHLPAAISRPVFAEGRMTGSYFNLPAFLIILIITWLLIRGVKESAGANNVMVVVKVMVILIFVFGAASAIQPAHWRPFMPNGFSGVLTGAAIVFFTYIGFDSLSTAAEETNNPQRNLPIGIIGTLAICALLYCSVALVLTGIVDWRTLNNDAPVGNALKAVGLDSLRAVVNVGAVVGIFSSLLVYQYGQTRIWFSMSRDRLLPDAFSRLHPRFRTPDFSTWVAGIVVGVPAGIWDIGTFADLSNIGTLFAFIVVALAVLILRYKDPRRPRSFRVPFVPLVPVLSVLCCLALMIGLPLENWIRFFVWLAVGLMIYLLYGKRRSSLVDMPHV